MEAPDTFDDLEALWLAWQGSQPEQENKYHVISGLLNMIGMPSPDVGEGWEESARREVWLWATGQMDGSRSKAKEKYEAWREEVKRERATDV